jgi:hypothetical protein
MKGKKKCMKVAFFVAGLIAIGSLVGTLVLTKHADENYSQAAKGNIVRLSLIYGAVGIIALIGITLFIFLK